MVYNVKSNVKAAETAEHLMENRTSGVILLESEEVAVVYGSPQYINFAVCNRRVGYTYRAAHIEGGIVCFPGDLSIMELKMGPSDFGQTAIQRVRDYLISIGCKAEVDGNDLMVDGLKCGSWACMSENGYTQMVVHFSVNVDVDLIRSVCTKPMAKTPGALSKYGVTAEVLTEVIRCLL